MIDDKYIQFMMFNVIGRICRSSLQNVTIHEFCKYFNGTGCIDYFLAADLGLRPPVRGLYSASEGSGMTFFALSAFCCNRIYRNMNSKHIISKPNKHRKIYIQNILHPWTTK